MIKQQEDRAVTLARQADEEENEFERGMLHLQLRRQVLEEISDETQEIGMGPVNLDVSMARAHGWSEQQIRRAWQVLRMVSQAEGEIAQANYPERYEDEDGVSVFVPDDGGSE